MNIFQLIGSENDNKKKCVMEEIVSDGQISSKLWTSSKNLENALCCGGNGTRKIIIKDLRIYGIN